MHVVKRLEAMYSTLVEVDQLERVLRMHKQNGIAVPEMLEEAITTLAEKARVARDLYTDDAN
jgi:hypothetical protein